MKHHFTVALLLATLLGGCQEESDVERSCFSSGHMATPACNYELAELSRTPQVEGVRLQAYLREDNSNLYLTENRDGSGASVRVGEVLDAPMGDAHWMVGHRVSIHGIFHHESNSLDIHSIRWINEPDVPRPIPPFLAPSGVSSAPGVDHPDPTEKPPDAGSMSSSSGDFFYFTHDSEGARICHEVWYTPEDRCYYRLDELANIHEPAVVGVRLYGFLLSRNGTLYMGTNREGTGIALPVTEVDEVVPEWLIGRLVETGHLTGLNGQYFPETKTIRAFSLSYVNLPGETPFRAPPPDQRSPSKSVSEPTQCGAPRYGEALPDDCIRFPGGSGQSSAE